MDHLPAAFRDVFARFAPLFSRPVWRRAELLLIGALLCPGSRTVAGVLRVLGLAHLRSFCGYHRVLSRSRWKSKRLSRTLLEMLLDALVPAGEPVILGIDETLERRRGAKIRAKGLYRDNARSSKSVHVKSHGLRWMSVMLLAPVPWAGRTWALPFLTVLLPSERCCREKGVRYKTLSHWARQVLVLLSRWLGGRRVIAVADNNYSALELLDRARSVGVCVITRLRLNAALYLPAPSREEFRAKHPRGQVPKKGARLPTPQARLAEEKTPWMRLRLSTLTHGAPEEREIELTSGTAVWFHNGLPPVPIRWVLLRDPEGKADPQCFLSTDPSLSAEQILRYFYLRWQVEVTFQEVRAHLGVETQRQWSEKAIERTTPVLLGLFSVVTLLAHGIHTRGSALPVRSSAWYAKEHPTFADALALVRQRLWPVAFKRTSSPEADVVLISRTVLERWTETLAYAA